MRKRYYVGIKAGSYVHEAFASESPPTTKSHGHIYLYSIGPFHRKMDAVDYVEHQHYMAPVPVLSTKFRACKSEEG